MALKNVLVALDSGSASDAALHSAVAIQKAYDAHLTAMVSFHVKSGASGDLFPWVPQAIRTTLEKAATQAHDAVEQQYITATATLEQDKIHLIERTTATDTSVSEAARFFDLTVVGIPAEMEGATLHPDRIALLSGRPVLAVPDGVMHSRVASKAAIAWDGSRAAARAMNSAMRVLTSKEEVVLLTVGAPTKVQVDGSGLDPKTALERQGIPAKWHAVEAKGRSIAQTLLESAAEHGAELLVMGAYEHSKFREDLFGGVTHDVMASASIPVFLAH